MGDWLDCRRGAWRRIRGTFLPAANFGFIPVLLLWSFNGVLQFAMWPSVTRIIAAYLLPEHSTKASVVVPLAIAAGNILSFCVASPVLHVLGWKGAFVLNVILLSVALVMWIYGMCKSEKLLVPSIQPPGETGGSNVGFLSILFSSGLIFAVLMAIAQGALDTGVKSWVPTMMMESYKFSPTISNIITAAMNLCNITGVVLLARTIGRLKNAVLIQSIYFGIFLPASIFMMFAII